MNVTLNMTLAEAANELQHVYAARMDFADSEVRVVITDVMTSKPWPQLSTWSWYQLAKSNKIAAIKLYRELSPGYVSLVDAKNFIERILEEETRKEAAEAAF